jgi:hypothetical protein
MTRTLRSGVFYARRVLSIPVAEIAATKRPHFQFFLVIGIVKHVRGVRVA